MSNKKKSEVPVPESMQVLFSMLFGNSSNVALKKSMTTSEWKRVLYKVLTELYNYLEANVKTDDMHFHMLCSFTDGAHKSLENDHFWPGYITAITGLSLILMGDYPDHRRRIGGRKCQDHYKLNIRRTLIYAQDYNQRVLTLKAASIYGKIPLSCNIKDVIMEFRAEQGYGASDKEFIMWFRDKYPIDYAKIF